MNVGVIKKVHERLEQKITNVYLGNTHNKKAAVALCSVGSGSYEQNPDHKMREKAHFSSVLSSPRIAP